MVKTKNKMAKWEIKLKNKMVKDKNKVEKYNGKNGSLLCSAYNRFFYI